MAVKELVICCVRACNSVSPISLGLLQQTSHTRLHLLLLVGLLSWFDVKQTHDWRASLDARRRLQATVATRSHALERSVLGIRLCPHW